MYSKKIINELIAPAVCCLSVVVIHTIDKSYTFLPICASLIIIYFKFRSLSSTKGESWISPEIVFLSGFFVLNFSLAILDLFSWSLYTVIIDDKVSYSSRNEALFYAFYALAAFFWGTQSYKKNKHENIKVFCAYPGASMCYSVTYCFIIMLVCMLVIVGPSYFFGGYQGVYGRSGLANGLYYLAQILGVASGALLIIRITARGVQKSAIEIIHLFPYFLLMLLYILSGDRGELIYLGGPIGFYIALSESHKKDISINKLMLIVAAVLFVVGFLREIRGADESFFNNFGMVFFNFDFVSLIGIAMTNVGSSGLLLPAAIDEVIENGYVYGAFTLNALLGMLPGVRGILVDAFGYGEGGYLESASLLSDRLLGVGATSGIGTSSVADLFIDFGLFGVILGHFFLGVGAKYISKYCWYSNSWEGKFLFATSIGVFAIIARYSLIPMLVKYVLFPFLLVFLVRKILRAI